MKLDLDFFRLLLEEVETKCDGIKPLRYSWDWRKNEEEAARAYHLKLMIDEGWVDGFTDNTMNGSTLPAHFIIKNLTFVGHQVLDAMRNDTIWNGIKENAKMLGSTGLKMIPALAIKYFLGLTTS